MRNILLAACCLATLHSFAQVPCGGNPTYRQFDFWIGEWDVYNKKGVKAGDSKIQLLLDSCVILENWTDAHLFKGRTYSGKSLNTYNSVTNQWQQTWVDNTGGTTEFLEGHYEDKK